MKSIVTAFRASQRARLIPEPTFSDEQSDHPRSDSALLLHHSAQVHLRKAGRDLKQAGWLRAFLNVAQLSAAALALPLHWKAQLGVEPEVAHVTAGIRGLVFHRAAAVHRIGAHLVAASTL